jgi:hypothetical protein
VGAKSFRANQAAQILEHLDQLKRAAKLQAQPKITLA